ncbi:MAG: TIM-barrel domain-containing protein [Muribaculaceae bacterium]
MRKNIAISLAIAAASVVAPISAQAEVVYSDNQVRFTLVDDATVRMEYAPDGKFVDNKSFVAVERNYDAVPHSKRVSGKRLTITTDKMVITYKIGSGAFTKENLKIAGTKQTDTRGITWQPGLQQKGNLKGTYRTLDGYDGNMHGDKPMPIENGLLATDGWTLIDDSESLLFDGDPDWDWVTTRQSAQGAQDWYFIIYGKNYKQALKSFTRFAGKMPLPPRYAFGYWWSRYWSYSDQDFRDLIGNFKSLDIPLDVLVVDMDWHPISPEAGGGWTGWDWNERLFPDYKQFLKFLDDAGVKTTMNLHPADGVRPYEKRYAEFASRYGDTGGKAVEFLGSDKRFVKALFDTYLHPYMDEGVDFWWIDWQQWLNDKKIPQLSNTFWCNYIWFSDMQRQGKKRPMLYHRWGGLGNHRYQIGFSGDAYITWKSLDYLPYFNSTASNVLYGYWSHDIGGHMSQTYGTPVEAQLYTRAMQLGKYLPVLRSHSTKDPALNKEPWAFGKDVQQRLIDVIRGRYELVPYIYTMARHAYETGESLCRPMYYDYPNEQQAYDYKNQYMFGNNMMIAPISVPIGQGECYSRLDVWLPQGEWLELETGTMLSGNSVVNRAFNINEFPVYVKAGSILPLFGKVNNLSGSRQPVTVAVMPGAESGSFVMYEDNGEDVDYVHNYATTQLSYERRGNVLEVKIAPRSGSYPDMPASRHFSVALPCQMAPKAVAVNGTASTFEYDGYNLLTTINLGEIDCAKGAVVTIEMPSADASLTDGLKAKLHRLRTAVAQYKQANCGLVYTERFGYLESAPLRMSYHPELQQQTLEHFNAIYGNLPDVLTEQMQGNEQHIGNFLKAVDMP